MLCIRHNAREPAYPMYNIRFRHKIMYLFDTATLIEDTDKREWRRVCGLTWDEFDCPDCHDSKPNPLGAYPALCVGVTLNDGSLIRFEEV